MSDEEKAPVFNTIEDCVQFLEQLESAPHFYAVELEASDRKVLHHYFEKNGTIGHKSIQCSKFGGSSTGWKACYECDTPTPALSQNYCDGVESNNEDHFYRMKCTQCGFSWTHECNYDDFDYYVDRPNLLVFGKDLKGFRKPRLALSKDVSVVEAARVLVGKDLYIMAPFRIPVRKRLEKFTNMISAMVDSCNSDDSD